MENHPASPRRLDTEQQRSQSITPKQSIATRTTSTDYRVQAYMPSAANPSYAAIARNSNIRPIHPSWREPSQREAEGLADYKKKYRRALTAPRAVASKALFIGDSTIRRMLFDGIYQSLDEKTHRKLVLAEDVFRFGRINTGVARSLAKAGVFFNFSQCSRTSGCTDCYARCKLDRPNRHDWLDYTVIDSGCNNTMEFSWKPELWTHSDEIAFEDRFCKQNYDVVVVSKGLHDAAWFNKSATTGQIAKLAAALRCFPPSTAVYLRTPLSSSQEDIRSTVSETSRMVVEEFNKGAFGPNVQLVDGHKISEDKASYDGHHYHRRTQVHKLVWDQILPLAEHYNMCPNRQKSKSPGRLRGAAWG